MKKFSFYLITCLLALTTHDINFVFATTPPSSTNAIPVRAELVASVDLVNLEKEYSVGVKFDMSPGWHIYWTYPGNTGKSTQVSFQSDTKHTYVLEPAFPAPEIFDPDPIESLSFGYKQMVLVAAKTMTYSNPPNDVTEIRAQVSWLACKDTCIPGKADLAIKLPVGDRIKSSKWKGLFEQVWKQLPEEDSKTLSSLKSLRYRDGVYELDFALHGFSSIEKFVPRWMPGGVCQILSFGIEPSINGEKVAKLTMTGADCLPGAGGIVVGIPKDAKSPTPRSFVISAKKAPAVSKNTPIPTSKVDHPATVTRPTEDQPRSIAWMLWLAFLGGLLLNIMPCVIPVVVPKLLHVVRSVRDVQDPKQKSKLLLQNSLAYTAGVLATMLALAFVVLVLKLIGHEAGWGFQFQSPWFLVFMISLLLVAGLGMLKTFPLKSSQHTDNLKQLKKLRRKSPLLESFFTGLLVTFLGTPCTAPFLGPALGYAFSQGSLEIALFLLVVGLGLSSPFLVLGLWTGWTRILPTRVTDRYDRVMRIMSFLFFATVLWLLGVIAKGHGVNALMNTLWFLLILALSAWLFGLWTNEHQSTKKRILILAPLLAVVILFGSWILRFPDQANASSAGNLASPVGINWQPFSEQSIKDLRAAGRTVFIDFTAEWCLNCKANEQLFIETEATHNLIERLKIAAVKADYTRFDPIIHKWLKRFKRAGVPMYLVFPACKDDHQVISLPEILTKTTLHQALKQAGPSLLSCR